METGVCRVEGGVAATQQSEPAGSEPAGLLLGSRGGYRKSFHDDLGDIDVRAGPDAE
jgi:hypothetical protein